MNQLKKTYIIDLFYTALLFIVVKMFFVVNFYV